MPVNARRWSSWFPLLVLTLLLCGILPPASASSVGTMAVPAPSSTGSISGTLTDSAGAVLRGARVSIPARNQVVFTDQQGRFFFSGLQPGEYTVSISYVGFKKVRKTVSVSAGSSTSLNLQLQVASSNQTVLVSAASASAEVEAVNEERAADNIMQVLPVKMITSLPAPNLGNALGRLPGVSLTRNEGQDQYVQVRGTEPRLTNTTVDGFNLPSADPGVREYDYSVLPPSIIDSVQVSKTLQANMDGDGIGASINIITKTATDTPTYEFTALGGYNPIENGRGSTDEYGTWGRRFGPGKKFGFIISGEYNFDGTGINDMEPTPDIATLPNGQTEGWFDAQDLRTYRFHRPRWGLGGSLDYRIKPGHTIYLRYLYSHYNDSGDKTVYTLHDNTPGVQLLVPGNSGCTGTPTDSGATTAPCNTPPSFYNQQEDAQISTGALELSSMHVLKKAWYSWGADIATSIFGGEPFDSGNFNNTSTAGDCHFEPGNTTDYHLPQWSPACFAEINQPQNYVFTGTQRSPGHSQQINIGFNVSAGYNWQIGKKYDSLEYGAKFRSMHQYANTYNLNATANTAVPMSMFPNRLKQPRYYNGSYQDGYNVFYSEVAKYVKQNPTDFTFNNDKGVDPSDFGLVEHIPAFYVMNTIDFARGIRLVAGLRAEITTDKIHNLTFDANNNASPNHFSNTYYDILPSASLRLPAGHSSFVRVDYSRGVSRPEEVSLGQAISWSQNGNGSYKYTASLNNPNLKAEVGDDLDVQYDHYFKTFGVFTAGYFYKHLSSPIVTQQSFAPNYQPPGGPAGSYLISQPINAGTSWLQGIELQYWQHWTGLPGLLGGLGMNANYSYETSRISSITGRTDHPRLPYDEPNSFNIGPTYNRGPLSMQMALNFNQAAISAYQYTDGTAGGPKGPLGDIYFYNHTQLDAQGGYKFGHGLQLIVSAWNLNNEEFGFYNGSKQYPIQREFYQPTYTFGLHWTPKPKH
uniref:TonB-dependent receptor n=1 Tax=Acidobacterium capsulatum TaxID=33075 RepID=A0A7V4XQQ5_9BACT